MTRPVVVSTVVVGALLWFSGFPELPGGEVRAQPQQVVQDIEYEAALNDGELALEARRFEEALEAFKDANERRDKKSPQAFYGLCRAHYAMGDYGDAAKACENGLKYAGSDGWLEARLHHERGLALTARATSNGDKALREAAEEFREVVRLTAEIPMAWFNLGVVTARQGHDDEGVAAFQAYLDSGATGAEAESARELRDSPRRLREAVAPEFSLQTLDGAIVSLKALRGRTVLLDFWATWCVPCKVAEPALGRLRKKYADEPFTIVGISVDRPLYEPQVRRYIEQHEMTWPQHIAPDEALPKAYDVDAIPTYVIIDGDGIVSVRVRGWARNAEQHLDDEIGKTLKAGEDRRRGRFFRPMR